MREVLVKCRVFRVKDKKIKQEVEVDKLAMEIEEEKNMKINNAGKGLVKTKGVPKILATNTCITR